MKRQRDLAASLGGLERDGAVPAPPIRSARRRGDDDEASLRLALPEALLAAVPDPVLVVGADGRILRFNQAADELLTTSFAPALVRVPPALLGAGEGDASDGAGPLARILAGETLSGESVNLRVRDGRLLPYEVNGSPVHDAGGRVVAAVMALRGAAALRGAEQSFRALLDLAETLAAHGADGASGQATEVAHRLKRVIDHLLDDMHLVYDVAADGGHTARSRRVHSSREYAATAREAVVHATRAYAAAATRTIENLGPQRWQRATLPVARRALERALELAPDPYGPDAARIHIDLAALLTMHLGEAERAASHARRALDLAQHLNDPQLEGAAILMVAWNRLAREPDLTGAISLLEHGRALAEVAGDDVVAGAADLSLAAAYLWTANPGAAGILCEHMLATAGRGQRRDYTRPLLALQALLDATTGRWDAAERALDRAATWSSLRPTGASEMAARHSAAGFLAYQRGSFAVALRELHAAVRARATGPAYLMPAGCLLGLAEVAVGHLDLARAHLDEQDAAVDHLPPRAITTAPLLVTQALLALALDDLSRAVDYYRRLLPFQGQLHWFLVDRALGQIALRRGDLPAAETHLGAAESAARQADLRPELARVLGLRAELELARGGDAARTRARAALREALALCRELGLDAQTAQTSARLRSLAHRLDNASATLPCGLTLREADVLRLVTAGKSNREIAAALRMAEKTASHHVDSICGKTQSPNRAAAAAFAVRHGLA